MSIEGFIEVAGATLTGVRSGEMKLILSFGVTARERRVIAAWAQRSGYGHVAKSPVLESGMQATPHVALMVAGVPDTAESAREVASLCSVHRDTRVLCLVDAIDDGSHARVAADLASDFMLRPVDAAEFEARASRLIARCHSGIFPASTRKEASAGEVLVCGPVSLDLHRHRLLVRGHLATLRPAAFSLLAYLVRHATRTVSTRELQREVLGTRGDSPGSVWFHIHEIRATLAPFGLRNFVATLPRVGYRLDPYAGRHSA